MRECTKSISMARNNNKARGSEHIGDTQNIDHNRKKERRGFHKSGCYKEISHFNLYVKVCMRDAPQETPRTHNRISDPQPPDMNRRRYIHYIRANHTPFFFIILVHFTF